MPGATFLEGDSVDLRTVEREDLKFLKELDNNPQVREYVDGDGPANIETEEEFFEEKIKGNNRIDLLIYARGEAVGLVNLLSIDKKSGKAGLQVKILPEHRGKGYAFEACQLVLRHGFENLRLHRIEASLFEFNEAGRNLLESLGFKHEGTHRKEKFKKGEYRDVEYYSILEDEF
ncbi:MAG: GNAT family N-acetyltransferase [Candidatus Nanohalobium sp.]